MRELKIYSKVAHTLKDGDVLHCYRKSFLGFFIRLFTCSKYNHSAIYHLDAGGVPYIFDAQKDGFQKRPFNVWVQMYGYNYDVTRNRLEMVNRETISLAYHFKGTPYAKKDLFFKHLWQAITGGWRFRTREEELSKVVCSEIVARCRHLKMAYRMTPKMLFFACLDENEIVIHYEDI